MIPIRSAAWIGLSLLAWLAGCASSSSYLAESRAADEANGPSAGAFYDDGSDGDTMARSEHSFGFTSFGQSVFKDTDGDGLPDTRLPDPTAPAERMMVYHGAMTLEVARAEDAIAGFLVQVKQWGGYLSAQQDRQLTVRLPAAQFDAAFAALKAMGRVLSESRQADDVTKQFTDLGIRLDNARQGRDRLLALLQKAEKVEDMLAIEKELRRLSEEIERMEGEQKFLADQVALATLQVEFRDVASPQQRRSQPSRFGWINRLGVQRTLEDF